MIHGRGLKCCASMGLVLLVAVGCDDSGVPLADVSPSPVSLDAGMGGSDAVVAPDVDEDSGPSEGSMADSGQGEGEVVPDAGGTGEDAALPTDAMAGDGSSDRCGSAHLRVGATAELVTHFHGVMGTVRIVDECTVVIEDFRYDGAGLDVRFYAGLGGAYGNGFAISGDLVRSGGYHGVEMRLTLPEGKTLDDFDGISLWCVDVGVSFGDASLGRVQA